MPLKLLPGKNELATLAMLGALAKADQYGAAEAMKVVGAHFGEGREISAQDRACIALQTGADVRLNLLDVIVELMQENQALKQDAAYAAIKASPSKGWEHVEGTFGMRWWERKIENLQGILYTYKVQPDGRWTQEAKNKHEKIHRVGGKECDEETALIAMNKAIEDFGTIRNTGVYGTCKVVPCLVQSNE